MPFQPTGQGYDTNATRRPLPKGVNGWLKSLLDGSEVPLWVYEIGTGFGMAGIKAQSQRTRSLFPHNMEQQQFTVSCQFPNQELYANAVEFIRSMQTKLSSSLILQVVNRGIAVNRLKGVHRDLYVEGYVLNAPRGHQRFIYAPELRFGFVAERIHEPQEWAGEEVKIKMLTTWREIIEEKKPGFVPVPELPRQTPPGTTGIALGPNGESRPG